MLATTDELESDSAATQTAVRRGKGDRDRMTMLLSSVNAELAQHLERVRAQHALDVAVQLPGSLSRKLPSAGRDWAWQWILRTNHE